MHLQDCKEWVLLQVLQHLQKEHSINAAGLECQWLHLGIVLQLLYADAAVGEGVIEHQFTCSTWGSSGTWHIGLACQKA